MDLVVLVYPDMETRLIDTASFVAAPPALLDHLTHHEHFLEMNGESYHLKGSRHNPALSPQEEPADA